MGVSEGIPQADRLMAVQNPFKQYLIIPEFVNISFETSEHRKARDLWAPIRRSKSEGYINRVSIIKIQVPAIKRAFANTQHT